jgi:methionyl aminopeptidase
MPPLDDHVIECYKKAGKAVASALRLGQVIARPGTKMLDLATLLEQEITRQGMGLAFPANLSLDNCAAHYSPTIDDPMVLPKEGLLKIDLGAHCEGYVADAAITVNLGKTGGVYDTLIKAATDALYGAIRAFKPGVNVGQIGAIIQREIEKYKDCRPIANLGGHQLKQYNLHAGTFVPNIARTSDNYIIQEGDQFAIEPFSTNGYGAIKNGPDMTIFRFAGVKKKKNLPLLEKVRIQKFKDAFTTLPFSPRWVDFVPKDQVDAMVAHFLKQDMLEGYHTFIERANGLVAQAEHTVIVTKDGAIPTTWWEDFQL